MGSDDGTVYMIRGETADEWVSPVPAEEVIVEAVVEVSDLDADEIDDLATYVDIDELAAVVNGGDESLTFEVEGHDVTVIGDGDVAVE
jgi:hypothetical protein